MVGAIDRVTDSRHVADDTGRRLVVDDADGLDRMRAIVGEPRVHGIRVGAMTPVAGNEFRLQAEPLGEPLPKEREVTGLRHQHTVARRQRVDERRFPCAGSGSRVDDDRLACIEDRSDAPEDRKPELRELGTAMVDRRPIDRAQHAVGNVRRSRNLQEVTPGRMAVVAEHWSVAQGRPTPLTAAPVGAASEASVGIVHSSDGARARRARARARARPASRGGCRAPCSRSAGAGRRARGCRRAPPCRRRCR